MIAVEVNTTELIDIAQGRNESFSSIDPESLKFNPQGAVTGNPSPWMGFQTEAEINPWWMVDLDRQCVLDTIVVYNRNDGFESKATPISVEASEDKVHWTLVCHVLGCFGGARDHRPLVVYCNDLLMCRYVRVRLDGFGVLSLNSVKVLASPVRAGSAERFCDLNFDLSRVPGRPCWLEVTRDYQYRSRGSDPIRSFCECITIKRFGRFGNNVFQLLHALIFARRYGVRKVIATDLSLPRGLLRAPTIVATGIEVVFGEWDVAAPPSMAPESELEGTFWDLSFDTRPVTSEEQHDAIVEELRPLFVDVEPTTPTTLTIHCRSGDVFADPVPPPHYGQPPLSFYKKAIEFYCAEYEIDYVVVVYEDRLNPVVDYLEQFLTVEGLRFRMQSSSLEDDVRTIMGARHLVASKGTFSLAAAVAAGRIRSLTFFRESLFPASFGIFGIDMILIEDAAGEYTKAGEWTHSDAQRTAMIDYPAENLYVRRL